MEKWWRRNYSPSSASFRYRVARLTSSNRAAVRLLQDVGIPKAVAYAKAMGVGDVPAVPSLALGSGEVSPMEMITAFTVFPNEGMSVEPYAIERIEDRFGNVLYDHAKQGLTISDAMNPRVAKQMTGMMRNVVNSGTAGRVRNWFPYEAAGKTGTTNDFADAWFVGYTPNLVAGIWIGYDQPRKLGDREAEHHRVAPHGAPRQRGGKDRQRRGQRHRLHEREHHDDPRLPVLRRALTHRGGDPRVDEGVGPMARSGLRHAVL